MQRESRLRRSADFERVRTKGRSWVHTILACYVYARNDAVPTRVGITVGRRTGGAVIRNRVRRRIREAVRALGPQTVPGHDVVLIARAGAGEASFEQIHRTVGALFKRAGLIRGDADLSTQESEGSAAQGTVL